MTFFCLLRGCQWQAMPVGEGYGMDCQFCARCGALRYHIS